MNKEGFTLIESIIYISIVAVLLVAVTDFHFSLGGTASKLSASIDNSRNRRTALSNIDYLIRNADGLLKDVNGDCSNFTSSPPILSLYFEDDTYLPGTCVSTGGGLNITVESDRVYLKCLPDITYNGEFEACDTTSGNTYYLTSPTVKVAATDLTFNTTSVERFTNITTSLTVNSLATEQTYLTSSALAESTISLRNQQDDGLIAWWKMDETGNSINSLIDSIGNHIAYCSGYPNNSSSLINGSTFANHFTSADYCQVTDSPSLNFENSFTLTAWIERDSTSIDRKEVINKHSSAPNPNEGYTMYVNNNQLVCGVFNERISLILTQNLATQQNDYADFIACVYDQNAGEVRNYVYKEGDRIPGTEVGVSSPIILVNSREDLFIGNDSISGSNYFAGDLDEVRIYNRALTDNEIYALETQGKTVNSSGCPECL